MARSRPDRLQVWAEDARFTFEGVGPGGIARQPNGVTIVALYSSGELFKVTQEPQGSVKVKAVPLERKLENPDGIQFAPDGSLLVVESAVASGDGRLVRIDVLSPGSEPKPIETIAAGMDTPDNLTVDGNNVWVCESRIRHRILPGREQEIPDRFFIRRFTLPHLKEQPYGKNRN